MPEKKYPRLFLATPSLDGKLGAEYAQAMSGLKSALYSNKINFTMQVHMGNSLLAGARNHLVDDFLQTDSDWMLMVDSDIAYRPEDVIDALPHLEGAIIGFPCSKKFAKWDRVGRTLRDNPEFPDEGISAILGDANFHLGVSDYLFPNEHGLAKVNWIGTGVMLVARSTFEKIMQENPDDKTMVNGRIVHEFFRYDMEWAEKNGVRYKDYSGEDVSFCNLARKSGITVYAKIDALTTHIGFMPFRFDAAVVAKLKNVPDQLEKKK